MALRTRDTVTAILSGIAVGLLAGQLVVGVLLVEPPTGPGSPGSGGGSGEGVPRRPLLESASSVPLESPHHALNATGPNVVLLLTDDQTSQMMAAMPAVRERVFERGVTFTDAYVTTPVCCPSRASILTGQNAHEHGVRWNDDTLDRGTFVDRLHEAGWVTGHLGKYLNSWNGTDRHEFTYWAAFENPRYHDPNLNVNGVWHRTRGYSAELLADHAVNFVERAHETGRPFLLSWSSRAPHTPAHAPGSLVGDYGVGSPIQLPSFNEVNVSDKPEWLERLAKPANATEQARFFERQLGTLHVLDHQVDRLLDTLQALDVLDETIVIVTSDNGMLHGQHRLTNKGWVYEPSVHVPMGIRYPPLVDAPRSEDALVANIDLAPTILDLAGLEVPNGTDGRSLVPLLEGEADAWRSSLLLEGWPQVSPPWAAVHDGRYVYVETREDRPELYDLEADPHQLENRAGDPALAEVQEDLDERLDELRPGWNASKPWEPPHADRPGSGERP